MQHTLGDILRALLERLTFWTRRNLGALEELTTQPLRVVRLTGGKFNGDLIDADGELTVFGSAYRDALLEWFAQAR